ncbi:hypothetical protein DDE82_006326 [Stemphylium lycopersici]|nr:hypothetical protein TW65_00289 [Stemphylium lycopersici]RAR01712.1 hypothetical protein DDE82_006326 [Stemphylium lycopersici]
MHNTHASDTVVPVLTPTIPLLLPNTHTLPLKETPQSQNPQGQHTYSTVQATSTQTQSIFFRLPAELRNQIYDELLCSNTPSHKELLKYSRERSHKAQPVYPAILTTCKRIHEEAQDLLYSTHIFHAHPSLLTALPHLVSPLQPLLDATAIAKIKRWQLSLRLDTDPRFTESQATAAFSGAEYLEIHAWQSMFDGCDDGVLKLFMGVRGVKVARVVGCAEGALARWLEGRMMMPVEEQQEQRCCCDGRVGGDCGKTIGCGGAGGMRWFGMGERDAWTFGNR